MTKAFDEALQAKLTGDATLTAIVGTRIWPEYIPGQTDAVYPFLTRVCSFDAEATLEDMTGGEMRLTLAMEAAAEDRGETLLINEALLALLNNFAGTLGDMKVLSMGLERCSPFSIQRSPGQAAFGLTIVYTALLDFV